MVNATPYLKRVKKINGEKILNIEQMYDTIQSSIKQGKKKVLLEVSENLQLPIDFGNAQVLDNEIQKRYGILYMKTPGGFAK